MSSPVVRDMCQTRIFIALLLGFNGELWGNMNFQLVKNRFSSCDGWAFSGIQS